MGHDVREKAHRFLKFFRDQHSVGPVDVAAVALGSGGGGGGGGGFGGGDGGFGGGGFGGGGGGEGEDAADDDAWKSKVQWDEEDGPGAGGGGGGGGGSGRFAIKIRDPAATQQPAVKLGTPSASGGSRPRGSAGPAPARQASANLLGENSPDPFGASAAFPPSSNFGAPAPAPAPPPPPPPSDPFGTASDDPFGASAPFGAAPAARAAPPVDPFAFSGGPSAASDPFGGMVSGGSGSDPASYSFEPAPARAAPSAAPFGGGSLLDAAAGGGSSDLLSLGAPDPMLAARLAGQNDLQLLGGVDMSSAAPPQAGGFGDAFGSSDDV